MNNSPNPDSNPRITIAILQIEILRHRVFQELIQGLLINQ